MSSSAASADADQEKPPWIARQPLTVISTIESLVQDWDVDEPIAAQTRVVADLEFESIDLIQMVAALEQAFGKPRVSLVDLLIVDGRYVDDLTVGQITDGVAARIARRANAPVLGTKDQQTSDLLAG